MTDSPRQKHPLARAMRAAIALAFACALLLPGGAVAAATRTLSYHGVRLTVPAGWPVFHLGPRSRVCVRFNRHAVYLGRPGANERCPPQALGRTEAILVSPSRDATLGGGRLARMLYHGMVITATWGRHPGTIRQALGIRTLTRALGVRLGAPLRSHLKPRATSPTSPAVPGAVFNGLGFDTCAAPPAAAMSAWGSASPYAAVGIYIGGPEMACAQPNLTASWVSAQSAAGWHLIPIYVGLQSPTVSGCSGCAPMAATPATAAAQGTAAAQDAVLQAQALGIGAGNPVYYDMEGYARTAPAAAAVLAFLQAWSEQLHASGYLSGVYSSAASGIVDLASQIGTAYVEPDDIWIADWNNLQSVSDPYLPDADWSGAQRLHQYSGGHSETYGAVTLNIDDDYLDGATAAFGSVSAPPPPPPPIAPAPSLTVAPQIDGSVKLTPQWIGEPGIASFQILAGDSPSTLAAVASASAPTTAPIVLHGIYRYFEVQALSTGGGVLGSSAPVAAPAQVAVFATTAYVSPRGRLAIPVACTNAAPCKVTAAIYRGSGLVTDTAPESVSRHGGLVHLALGARISRLIAAAHRSGLPVRLSLKDGAGTKTKTYVRLVAYRSSGRPPRTSTGTSSTIAILQPTALVSSGWVGGVLVACTAAAPCKPTLRLTTRSRRVIATGRTPTVGAGEIAQLHFQMTRYGHALLRASKGNQLAARLVIRDALAAPANGAATIGGGGGPAVALVSLSSY